MQAVLILVYLPLSYAANHTMQRLFTAMPGIKLFPEYVENDMVDGEIITHYDSITQRKVPVLTCMKDRLDPQYWDSSTMESKDDQEFFMSFTESIEKDFNQTGVHVLQGIRGCWWEDESGATDSYIQNGYDGEDISIIGKDVLDINREGKEQSFTERLKMYLQCGKGCLDRIVPPEVFVFLGRVSSSVVCLATGFHPKAINMTLKRDGVEMQEDVNVRETLPNGDGTYQKRAELTVSPEERERSQYTCEVEHASGIIIKTLIEPGWSSGLISGIVLANLALSLVLWVSYQGLRSRTSQDGTGPAQMTRYGSIVLSQREDEEEHSHLQQVPGITSGASSDHPGVYY